MRTVARCAPDQAAGNQLNVAIDMSSSFHSRVQFGYRDPAHLGACGGTFNLGNARGNALGD